VANINKITFIKQYNKFPYFLQKLRAPCYDKSLLVYLTNDYHALYKNLHVSDCLAHKRNFYLKIIKINYENT